jgi:hypothetical protein
MTAMTLPWRWPVEPEGGCPPGRNFDPIIVDTAPEGWVAIQVGASDGYLPPDKVEEFIAAVRAAVGRAG